MVADSYTSILGILVMGTGNDNNTWGDNFNSAIGAILEKAICGRAAHAGLTGGTLDLSTTTPPTGATTALEFIHDFAGTLTSNQIVQVPNVAKTWLVRNNLTLGGFTLTFKTASGSASAAIPVGWCLVWCDGSNVIYVGLSTALRDTQWLGADGTVALPAKSYANDADTGERSGGYATGTLGNNPFTTTNSSVTVSVSHTSHAVAVNDFVNYSGGAAVGGLTLNQTYRCSSVTDANTYKFLAQSAATAGATGGGGGVTYKYMRAATTGGNAEIVTTGGADTLHLSAYGAALIGSLYATGDLQIAGNTILMGTLNVTGAVTVPDASFSYAKLQNVSATSRIMVRKTAGAGAMEEGTLSDVLDFIGSAAQGDILYRGATTWARLPAGTSGLFFKTLGAAANPLWAATVLGTSFTSGEQAITAGGALVIAHGLGAMPALIQPRLICKTAEGGYSISDEILINPVQNDVAGSGDRGLVILPDATNLSVRFGDQPGTFGVFNKSNGAAFVITNANWRLILRAWV